MRVFIASSINRFDGLNSLFEDIRKIPGSKPVTTNELHLTFRFIGEVGQSEYEAIRRNFVRLELKEFPIVVRGVGAFPGLKRARVLFLRVENHQTIEENWSLISSLPPRQNGEKFVPHITVARFKQPPDCSELSEKYMGLEFKGMAGKISIYNSRLTPDGPQYSELESVQLK